MKREEALKLYPERVAVLDAAKNAHGDAWIEGFGCRVDLTNMDIGTDDNLDYYFSEEKLEYWKCLTTPQP